jgi:hypothetical protein
MTELERELKATLQIQEEMFSKELKSITKIYEKHLADVTASYNKQMSEATEVIKRQSEALEKYESISTNWQISIDEEQMQKLMSSHSNLLTRLEKLEEQDEDLLEQLNGVLKKL